MLVRDYQTGDESELWNLFFNTIRLVNIQDYTVAQVRAWAPDELDAERWRRRIQGMKPYICEHEEVIVGYAGMLESGYVDHFYVHHRWQGQGVGKRLFERIESEARRRALPALTADVSITAKPFFQSRGFTVVTPQEVTLGTVVLTNFKMAKSLTIN